MVKGMNNTVQERESEQAAPEAVVRVDIDAAPDDVWHALTSDDGLAGWLGEGSTIGSYVGDDIDVRDVVTGQRKRGVLDEVSPGHRLGYTWWPETAPEDATRVAISIEPTRAGTRVTVVESRPRAATASISGAPSTKAAIRTTQITADWLWRTALLTISCRTLQFAGHGGGARGQ